MDEFEQCESRLATKVFSHYAYGDMLPVYARYIGEGTPTRIDAPDAITVYVRCERPAGHEGKHLAHGTTGWVIE